jgi:peptidoglycan/LPS O-acetylase OafA/YrhL
MLPHQNLKYRADIDGLRALAVLAVVCFHAYPSVFWGGFIGVDIFFVISGFLISGIIFDGLEKGSFIFSEFYIRRVRRIFPALLVVLAATLFLGWFFLLPDEYQQLSKHVFGGAGFMSNLVLYKEAGYFDGAAERKPLLHLWSLGIEEQFYLIWPLFLWFAWRRRWNILKSVAWIGIFSFVLNLILVRHSPTSAFYLPLTRFWELLVGVVLAHLTRNKNEHQWLRPELGNVRSGLGIALLALGLIFIDRDRMFPGFWAILPTAGAFLLLSAGENSWINQKILAHPVLKWVGLISFPLYLWHWPLLAYARVLGGEQPGVALASALVAISIALATLTYYLVEIPLRFGKAKSFNTVGLCTSMTAIAAVGIAFFWNDGLTFRKIAKLNTIVTSGEDGGDLGLSVAGCGLEKDGYRFGDCKHDSRAAAPRYALLGDSKARAIYEGLVRTSTEKGRWVFVGGRKPGLEGVTVIPGEHRFKSFQRLTLVASNELAKNKEINSVVIAIATRELFRLKHENSIEDLPTNPNYDEAYKDLNELVQPFVSAGKKVVLLVDNPTLPDARDCIERKTGFEPLDQYITQKFAWRCHVQLSKQLELSKQYRDLLSEIERNSGGKVKVFDTMKYMCDQERGRCDAVKNGRMMYSYTDHISDYAAGVIGKDLNQFLNQQM